MARRKRGTFLNKQAPLSLKQRTKRILIWTGVALGMLLIACVTCYLYLLSWLQGDGFRSYLADRLQQRTGAAEVSIPENLVVNGNHMTLPACTLRRAGNLEELGVRKLHLEVDRPALLRRMLHLHHFSVEEMQIAMRVAPGANGAAPSTASLSASSDSVFIKDVKVRSFESHYTDTSLLIGEKQYSLNGYHLVALPRPDISKDAWAIGIENGRIRTPFSWLKESGVKSATLLYRGDDVQLSECKIELAPGNLIGKGVYRPGSGLWKARVDVNQANVARLLSDDWRKRLKGELWGSLDMSGEMSKGTWEARGELNLKKGVLEGLPILSDINLHGTAPYRTLELEKATCQISYPYSEPEHGLHNAWLWDNIDIRSKGGNLLIRGRVITGTDGSLAGTISVGVPHQLVADMGLSNTPFIAKLFNAPIEVKGYMWLRINLSGTISQPQEDISVRMEALLHEAMPVLAKKATGALGALIDNFVEPGKKDPEQENAEDAEPEQKQPEPAPTNKVRDIIDTGLKLIF